MTELPKALTDLGRSIQSYLLPVFVGDIRSEQSAIESNGTAFLFKPGSTPFLVTAGHVFDAAVASEKSTSSGKTGVGDCRMAFQGRLIGRSNLLDVATIRVSEEEAKHLGGNFVPRGRSVWPPPAPNENDLAVLAGYPGVERHQIDDDEVSLGIYSAYLRVGSIGPRHVRFTINPSELMDFLGTGLPEDNYPLGGLSGAPVILLENETELKWRLCGVVTDQGSVFEQDFVLAARADYILESGEINEPPA